MCATPSRAAIRLVPDVDTIGVPVFAAVNGNAIFTPEMDGNFRIIEFNEFFNEHGLTITYDLPKEFRGALYSLQNSTPIPFWLDNVCHIIPGDADKEEPEKLFGAKARTTRSSRTLRGCWMTLEADVSATA